MLFQPVWQSPAPLSPCPWTRPQVTSTHQIQLIKRPARNSVNNQYWSPRSHVAYLQLLPVPSAHPHSPTYVALHHGELSPTTPHDAVISLHEREIAEQLLTLMITCLQKAAVNTVFPALDVWNVHVFAFPAVNDLIMVSPLSTSSSRTLTWQTSCLINAGFGNTVGWFGRRVVHGPASASESYQLLLPPL